MEFYDILMLAVLIGATIFGAWKGLAWQVASLGAIVASYFVALRFRDAVATHIQATPPWNTFVAMLVLYVATSLVIWLVFRMVSNFIDRLKLKEFDRQIGALFGFAKGVLLCVIVTLFAVTLLGDTQRQAIVESRSGYYIARLLDKSNAVMPPELSDVLRPYIDNLEQGPSLLDRDDDGGTRPLSPPIFDDLRHAMQEPEPAPSSPPSWR